MPRNKENKIDPNRLNESMSTAKVNGKQLAQMTGITEETISRYRTGKGDGGADKYCIKRIAEALRVSEAFLLLKDDFRNEGEKRAYHARLRASRERIEQSPIAPLLERVGYRFEGVYVSSWPEDRRAVSEVYNDDMKYSAMDQTYTEEGFPVDDRPDSLRSELAALEFSDYTYRFSAPSGARVDIPAVNFEAAEKMIEDIARSTFKNMFDNWIGVEAISSPPPEKWRVDTQVKKVLRA